MFSEITSRSLTVNVLIERIEKLIGEYGAKNNELKFFEEISDNIREARSILNYALDKADPTDNERIGAIDQKFEVLCRIEQQFNTLKRV
jgi:hypothetical protein